MLSKKNKMAKYITEAIAIFSDGFDEKILTKKILIC